MSHYEFKHVPDTPYWRVYVNGRYRQEFTSLAAAKAYVEHLQKFDGAGDAEREALEEPCQCYGCVTMRHPCVKEINR